MGNVKLSMTQLIVITSKLFIFGLLASFGCCSVAWCADVEKSKPADSRRSQDELLTRGEAIYREKCASCHGANGEGVTGKHATPLVGDSTIGELTKVITETMPEDDPDACVGEDSEAVSEFIHYRFYSEAAQIRNRPSNVSFSRLTGTQLRQSIADLYARFNGQPEVTADRGVKAIYFDGARWKNENKKIQRTDAVIDFDFGNESPGEGIKADAFYIYWEGGIKADVTGRYEIIVRSSCSFKMDFGKLDRQFIDNHVQSGDRTEFRQPIVLTAGRIYPFKIDFIQKDRKTENPPARISVSWIKPGGVEEIIPTLNLVPNVARSTFSIQTTMPPDDRSYGFERGISVSRQWDDATTAAALEFAQVAAAELWPRYERQHKDDSDEGRSKLRKFLAEIVEVAFRGSLDEKQKLTYIDKNVDAAEDDVEAMKRTFLMALKSPYFLYPSLDVGASVSQQAANRLSLILHDSLPSEDGILSQIKKENLTNEKQIRDAAKRMVKDYRTQAKVRQMMHEWLNIGHFADISKDAKNYPGFDSAVVADLRSSLEAFLDEVIWSEASDYRQLFLSKSVYTNDRLADFYGDSWKPVEGDRIQLRLGATEDDARFGLLTHPYLMSGLAYHNTTSPIHRGVFLIRYMLGRTLRPPNEAFSPLSPDLHPELTTRERVELQTSSENCQGCHIKINGLGFTLENYDAVGRYREKERDKTILSVGHYTTRSGDEVELSGASDLANYLASSSDSHRAFVNRAFQYFVKQPITAYGPDVLDELTAKFTKSGCNIRELIVEIAVLGTCSKLMK
jgi:hypothetical protein